MEISTVAFLERKIPILGLFWSLNMFTVSNSVCMMTLSNTEAKGGLFCMASEPINGLTREDILRTARAFTWNRQLPKWTVIIEGRELPARPLVLEAAGVPPNDPTNSHQAVAKLKSFGFDTRYEGKSDQDRTWKKQINGATVVFKEQLQKSGVRIYECRRSIEEGHIREDGTASDHSEQKLTADEVEKLPKIADFLAGTV
jgi:hypothetical protein